MEFQNILVSLKIYKYKRYVIFSYILLQLEFAPSNTLPQMNVTDSIKVKVFNIIADKFELSMGITAISNLNPLLYDI